MVEGGDVVAREAQAGEAVGAGGGIAPRFAHDAPAALFVQSNAAANGGWGCAGVFGRTDDLTRAAVEADIGCAVDDVDGAQGHGLGPLFIHSESYGSWVVLNTCPHNNHAPLHPIHIIHNQMNRIGRDWV